ncbi:hypothetical protein Tco_1296696 [Tanacetum coccineum]
MSPRSSALLLNLLPPKENDPGNFVLPCSIGRLDFNNALADLGASISIMPFSMFKRLGIGKLEPIKVQESYEEIVYKSSLIAQEANKGLGPFMENMTEGMDEDDDDLEWIIDYLEPTLYDGFIDSDDEDYKERKCKLLGMPYIKPPPILIEKVNVTRYSIGPGEVYTKLKVLKVDELSRTRGNITTIRAGIMDKIFRNDNKKESYDEMYSGMSLT